MKLFTSILLFTSLKMWGQAPTDLKFYIKNNQVSRAAKDYYYRRFMAIDDNRTFSIIDSLNTKNNLTRPFYLLVVSKMLKKADGALSEAMGVYCKKFIELHPDFLIGFLFSKNKLIEKNFINDWASQLAGEFSIDSEMKRKLCINESLQKSLKKVSVNNSSKLKIIYNRIEKFS